MADEREGGQTVMVVAVPAAAAAISALATAAGWREGGERALVRIVDARDDPARVAAEDARTIEQNAALLAIVADERDAADRAYADGATHVVAEPLDVASLERALRFAGRHARRLRGLGRGRRAGEAAPGAVARFIASRAPDAPLSVALIALTRFDLVNAAFGRAAGDALLSAAVERIAAALPMPGMVERGEGALFVVAIAAAPDAAERALTDADARLARSFPVAGGDANLGVRLGMAHRAAGESATALWRRAQEALDAAQRSAGARLRVAGAPPSAAPAGRLAADLHRAIDRREIDLLFQPQARLGDDAIVGVEALARWEHPEHGVLGADTLFAAAARADLGLALSEHIQSLAAVRAARWPRSLGALRVSVNVTAAELTRPGFAERFLARTDGLEPARVTAEITETELVTDLPAAAAELAALRARGVRIAVDDFGTGYSSLAYLAALPIDYLKLDRSLTQQIEDVPRGQVVVRAILRLARDLGVETIVEGVEHERQRALLAAEGCTLYQGFLRAGPLDQAGLLALVEGG